MQKKVPDTSTSPSKSGTAKTSTAQADAQRGQSEPKRKRGCLGCLGRAFLVLVLLSIPTAFLANGPGFRWAVGWALDKGLAKIQRSGAFEVEGTLLSGVKILNLTTAPLPAEQGLSDAAFVTSPIRELSVGLAEVGYRLSDAIDGDPIDALQLVRLRDVKAVIELPPKKDTQEKDKPEPSDDSKADRLEMVWKFLDVDYDLENISVQVFRDDEQVMAVDEAKLQLSKNEDGSLGFTRLQIGENIERHDVSASLRATDDSLVLGRFEPIDRIALDEFTLHRSGQDQLTALLDLAGGSIYVALRRNRSLSAELREGSVNLGEIAQRFGFEKAVRQGQIHGLDVQFAGNFSQPSSWKGSAQLGLTKLEFPGLGLDSTNLQLSLNDSKLEAKLDAKRSGAEAHIDITSSLSGVESTADLVSLPIALNLDLDAAAVENFIPDAHRTRVPVTGGVALKAAATIVPKPWQLNNGGTATLRSDSLQWDGVAIDSLELLTEAVGTNRYEADLRLTLDEASQVSLNGQLGTDTLDYEATVEAGVAANERLRSLLATFGFDQNLAGSSEINWQGKGSFKNTDTTQPPSHQGELDTTASALQIGDGRKIDDLVVAANYSPQKINVAKLQLTSAELAIDTNGGYDLDTRQVTIPSLSIRRDGKQLASGSLELPYDPAAFAEKGAIGFFQQTGKVAVDFRSADLRIEDLIALSGKQSPVSGGITATIDLHGTPTQLKGGGQVQATNLKASAEAAEKVPPGDLAINFGIIEERLTLDGSFTHPQIEPFTLKGNVPFTPEEWLKGESDIKNEPLQLTAQLPPSSLDFLRSYVPKIERLQGSAAIDVKVSGTVAKPEIAGSLKLLLDEFHMENRQIPSVHDGIFEIRAEGRELSIETFEALVSGGKVVLTGGVSFPQSDPGDEAKAGPLLDLALNAREALIARTTDLNIRANADLSLKGPWSAAALSGEIALVNSRFVKSINILPISVPGRDRSDLPEVEKRPAAVKVPPNLEFGVTAAPFKDWTLDVALVTRDPFLVRGNLARVDAVSDLKISGQLAKPIPTGRVYITDGRLTLPFSKVNIQKGELKFSEATGFNGELDVQAVATVRQYDVNIYVYDRLLKPKHVLTSDPPLPSEDIISLLATGTTREELTGGSGAVVASKAALLFLKKLRDDDIDPDEDPNFLEQLNERTTLDIGQTDQRTGQQTVAGRIRLFRQLYLVANVGAESEYRGLLKYIFRFR